ncbi:MAG: hypothetical protein PWR03_49 [Tenuifilum sp.]|jgi:hypothetical protein|uniref:hypothetical protein n=1 Tax=Tenuifilum sp. TaxID=2760880 RepID=UPI0024AAEE59|nr:hypothetical protein [Tenuifilum sp.]MDI3525866.1 hypothetical protein [Tenuifilum sp.]
MIPILFDLPSCNQEINKNKIEFLTSVTTLVKNEDISFSSNIFINFNKSFNYYNYFNNIGTTIISESNIETPITNIDFIGFYNDNYDIVVKLPVVKSLTKKVKIKSITKFSPRIIL